jgi:hypothetical protein
MTLMFLQQVFRYTLDTGEPDIVWDINKAKAMVAAGLVEWPQPQPITLAMMQEIADANEWEPEHVDEVDPSRPGIAAPILHQGQVIYILIDGHHRNARALREGRSFSAYLLTNEASRACVVEPDHPRLP